MLRESFPFHESPNNRGRAVKVGSLLRSCSVWIVALTLAVVPWILGGAIPHARFVLLAGSITAAILALSACLVRKEAPLALTLTALPLLGFCLIALVQLMPIFEHPALQMKHAVQQRFAADLPVFQRGAEVQSDFPRTVLPAGTRQGLAQFLALALIAMVVRETAATQRELAILMVSLVLSGCCMTVLALSQQYGVVETVIGNHWKVGNSTPFGCFVNPNNAAGWLIVCLAAAFYLGGRSFRNNDHGGIHASQRWTTLLDRIWMTWARFVGRLANVNTAQILASAAIILLMGGIAATLSRAGILAGILGLFAFGVSRFHAGKWLAALSGLAAVLILSCLFLSLMDLDTVVVSELQTLKDPVSDSTGRLLHWTDSLQSVRDFPWIGSGLSAYRCASMPYQRHYTGKWFQRADNQYVEVLVECGLAGLALFACAGLLFAGFALKTRAITRWRSASEANVAECLSGSAFICIVGLGAAAFFDFGISQSSVSAALVAMMAMLERWSERKTKRPSAELPEHGSGSRLSGVAAGLVWVLVIAASVSLLPDTLAAARVFDASVPVERLESKPEVVFLIESGDSLQHELELALAVRSDDILGHRVRVILLELLCRRDLLLKMTAGRDLSPQQKNTLFNELDPGVLAFRMIDSITTDDLRQQVRTEIEASLNQYPWRAACSTLLARSVGLPSLGLMQIESDFLYEESVSGAANIAYLRFSEPHVADGLFELGLLLLRVGRVEESRDCWNQSLAASEALRPEMLAEIVRSSGSDAAIEWLMPDSYESSVNCALATRASPPLQQKLFDRAAQIWVKHSPPVTESLILLRVAHLTECNRVDDALSLLDGYLGSEPTSLRVRKSRADVLERTGRIDEAYDEWLRIGTFHPDEPAIEAALDRLTRMTSKPDR